MNVIWCARCGTKFTSAAALLQHPCEDRRLTPVDRARLQAELAEREG